MVRRRPSRLLLERLETRTLPTSMLYLDFGDNFPSGGFELTDGQLGTNLSSGGLSGPSLSYSSSTLLRFLPASQRVTFDYNGSGGVTSADWTDLRANVLSLVQRYYTPFDVTVVLAPAIDNSSSSAYMEGVRTVLNSGPALTGERDAWCFACYATVASSGASVGGDGGFYGIASGRDIGGTNANDDSCLVAADVVFGNFGNASADTAFGYTCAHEPAHNFGLAHTSNVALSNSDIIVSSAGSTNRTNLDFFTRYPLALAGGGISTNYDRFASTSVLGLRPNTPVYITGTGENDIITVTSQSATQASVTVQAFTNATYMTPITVPGSSPPTSTYSYTVALDPATGLFIDSGFDNDRIIIDATIGVPVTIRGMGSTDQLIVHGNGAASGTYTPNASAPVGLDGAASYGGQLVIGATTITFSEFETASTVEIDGVSAFTVVTPNSNDALTVDTVTGGRFRVTGSSGGVTMVPLLADVGSLTVDTGANDSAAPNDTVTVNLGGVVAIGRQCTVSTGAGADVITVTALASNTTLNLQAGTGDDTAIIDSNGAAAGGTVDNIRGTITVDGQGGADAVYLDDSSDTSADVVTVDGTHIGDAADTYFGAGGSVAYSNLASLNLVLTSAVAGDIANVTPSDSVAIRIDGNAPTPGPTGDRVILRLDGVSNPVRTPSSATNGMWTFADRQPVNYVSIEEQFVGLTPNVVVGDGTAQRSRVDQLTVEFGQLVTLAGAPESAFVVERIENGVPIATVGTSVTLTTMNGATVATIHFTSDTTAGSLNDGRYRVTVLADQVQISGVTVAANTVQDFHRYFGDINGDERVDIADFGLFSTTYGLQTGQTGFLAAFDYNSDGVIDIADFGQFAIRMFTTLP